MASAIEGRQLAFEDGRWLNAGQDLYASIQAARAAFAALCARKATKELAPPRTTIEPEAMIERCRTFLAKAGRPPLPYLIDAVEKHRLVVIAECHHRPLYWSFYRSLLLDDRFLNKIGTVYLELPEDSRSRVARFLASTDGKPGPVIAMLRDVLIYGWPDQGILDFFVTAWLVNRRLPPERRITIVPVDMARPWHKIRNVSDWRRYDVDRDDRMAANVTAHIRSREDDGRSALLILGVSHGPRRLRYFDGTPMPSATRKLIATLGGRKVHVIVTHQPRLPNMGAARGRLRDGLFDEVLAAHGRPVAFPLESGPFGAQPFDAFPERPAAGSYGQAFDGYLYLGRLEDELYSPLIAGFYTDRFVREVDRRWHLTYGRGWSRTMGRPPTARSFIAWMQRRWGRPRFLPRALGSMRAWRQRVR